MRPSRLSPPAQQITRNVLARFVGDVFPVARAGGPYSCPVGQVITFSGGGSSDADGTLVSYRWAFGDGSTGIGASITHSYAVSGSYTATLTVTDNRGRCGENKYPRDRE
jgi:PKD domain-containing protein